MEGGPAKEHENLAKRKAQKRGGFSTDGSWRNRGRRGGKDGERAGGEGKGGAEGEGKG